MILDELMLHDFGVYAGRHVVRLTPPAADKPVILFYGLNGCGKTTILEAMQVALFGAQAPFLREQDYREYISRRINKNSRHRQTSLRLDFHRGENGRQAEYRVRRVWKQTLSGVKETLDVVKDGQRNAKLSSGWSQYVEEIISARLAHFFFFDGEKIEEYASPEGARQLISVGMRNLLGLDLIDKGEQDMNVLRRRKLAEGAAKSADETVKRDIEAKRKELSALESRRQKLVAERARLQTHEADADLRELNKLAEERKRLGGDLWDRRENIKHALAKAEAERTVVENLVRETLCGPLPLALTRKYFAGLERCKTIGRRNRAAKFRRAVLQERDLQILNFLSERKSPRRLFAQTKEYLENSRAATTEEEPDSSPFFDSRELDEFAKESLTSELAAAQTALARHLDRKRDLEETVNRMTAEEALIPQSETMRRLSEQHDALEARLARSRDSLSRLDAELDAVTKDIAGLQKEIDALLKRAIEMDAENKRLAKYVGRIESARDILRLFSRSILESKTAHVERRITESCRMLLRKEELLRDISIDRNTMDIRLRTPEGDILAASRLSAGERQLLSISILWGLARSSSQPFPVAVDTPFGRLDSEHRRKLVANYFPAASHQVVLFSTDEEIVGEYRRLIEPSVGRAYDLNYDPRDQNTRITERL